MIYDSGSVHWVCDVMVSLLGVRLLEVPQWHCSCAALIVGGSALGVGSALWQPTCQPLASIMLP